MCMYKETLFLYSPYTAISHESLVRDKMECAKTCCSCFHVHSNLSIPCSGSPPPDVRRSPWTDLPLLGGHRIPTHCFITTVQMAPGWVHWVHWRGSVLESDLWPAGYPARRYFKLWWRDVVHVTSDTNTLKTNRCRTPRRRQTEVAREIKCGDVEDY